jgi:hypothetical protein
VAAAEPAVVAAPEVAAPEVAAEEVVDAVYEDEASASNISADADELIPVPPPPGYEPVPVPEFSSSSAAALVDAHPPLVKKEEVVAAAPARSPRALPVPDLNLPAPEKEEDEPVPQLPTPSLEARVILRGWSLPPPLMELPVAVARGHSHGAGERWKKKMLELGVIHSSIPF